MSSDEEKTSISGDSTQEDVSLRKKDSDQEGVYFCERNSAFKCRISTYELKNKEHFRLEDFFRDAFALFELETQKLLKKNSILKLNACLEAKFIKPSKMSTDESEDSWDVIIMYIQTPNKIIDRSKNILKFYTRNITKKITTQISEMEGENGSGWSLHEIMGLVVNNNKHQVFNGATHLPLPAFIQSKKAVINVKNEDNQCFKWAVLSALHSVRNAYRVSSYKAFENELNFKNMTFPVTLDQIDVFEKQNETISIHVYAIEDDYDQNTKKKKKIVVPIRIASNTRSNHIHLLWYSDVDVFGDCCEQENEQDSTLCDMVNNMNVISHYCFIKDLAKLVSSQCSNHKSKIWLCDRCLHYFYSEMKLAEHSVACENRNKCKISLPLRNSMQRWTSFNHFDRQLPIPFIVYADIESLLQTIPSTESKMPKGAYQKHVANSIGYYLHDLHNPDKSEFETYSGIDCIGWFVKKLYNISIQVASKIRYVEELVTTASDEQVFIEATNCHICQKKFDGMDVKVRDHSHLTGVFRGAAHRECNLKYQEARILPVVFHNLNYDSHFLIEKLSSEFKGKLDIIPINSEHYISFTKHVDDTIFDCENSDTFYNKKMRIRFIDSYRFLPDSLQKLASSLPKDKLLITRKEWKNLTEEKFDLLCQKGVYPYDYMDTADKLNETKLPPKNLFYNQLNDQHITDEEYAHATRVWKAFGMKNLLGYTNIYLKTDILLLADIFENFRMSSINLYGLDPAHYYTTPGLSWDAMLKHTKVRLEMIIDIDMLLFVEKGIVDKTILE